MTIKDSVRTAQQPHSWLMRKEYRFPWSEKSSKSKIANFFGVGGLRLHRMIASRLTTRW